MTCHPRPEPLTPEAKRRKLGLLQKHNRYAYERYLALSPEQKEQWWGGQGLPAQTPGAPDPRDLRGWDRLKWRVTGRPKPETP